MGKAHDYFVNAVLGVSVGALLGFILMMWIGLYSADHFVVTFVNAACFGIPLGACVGGISAVLIAKFL